MTEIRLYVPLAMGLLALGSTGCESRRAPLTADSPLHLEDHLDAATIVGSEITSGLPPLAEWRFDEAQPDWKPVTDTDRSMGSLRVVKTDEALRVTLDEDEREASAGRLRGEISVGLEQSEPADWSYVLVRARSSVEARGFELGARLADEPVGGGGLGDRSGLQASVVAVINDGQVQTYVMPLARAADHPFDPAVSAPWGSAHGGTGGLREAEPQERTRRLGLVFKADDPASIDLLSVSIIPLETDYADVPVGVRTVARGAVQRRTLYTHAPGRVDYRIRVPQGGRLDVGLAVLRDDAPVTFRIGVRGADRETQTLLEESYSDGARWGQRTLDLSDYSGQIVNLSLEAEAERAGTVALWGAPTLTGVRATVKPNVIFYVIDGAAAELMSVYGYERGTTPNLERIAAEGAIFEYAYSNSDWSKPSTASFMTSLHHSVLGGLDRSDPIPDEARTMAELLHAADYQTAVFASNPYAGSLSNLQRGVDVFRDGDVQVKSMAAAELHADYWSWRDAYPGEPYWVHFQPTDVHDPWESVAPFAGRYVDPERRSRFYEWRAQLREAGGFARWWAHFDEFGIDRREFSEIGSDLYDETMAHLDHRIGRLVEQLKARGEWERTLFVVAADHGQYEAGLPLLDPMPPGLVAPGKWTPNISAWVSRIPLIIVWPERISPGQRFSDPVSMIDVLPTILELTDTPGPEILQGRSLAPLLLGEKRWEPTPVILDEFYVDEKTGELNGVIEVVDGRWGASLEINPTDRGEWIPPENRRPAPLLLYDLRKDPQCLHSLHEERPDLVEKYTAFLEARWGEHQALAQRFTQPQAMPITAEQLRALRALGYIQ